jgi:hypothetical protein
MTAVFFTFEPGVAGRVAVLALRLWTASTGNAAKGLDAGVGTDWLCGPSSFFVTRVALVVTAGMLGVS